jgi:Uma2 family endonuclease
MTAPHHYFTPEQYLDFEVHSETRHEYVDGQVYAMSGATLPHNRIVANLVVALYAGLRGRPCDALTQDMRVRVGPGSAYVYPDLVGLCGDARVERADENEYQSLLNPSFVVEVLSPSTESYDRGRKFALYRRIPTLREYVLVAQDRMHAERYTPAADPAADWVRVDVDSPDGTIELPSVGAILRLGDLYERVELPPHPPRPRRVREPEPSEWR